MLYFSSLLHLILYYCNPQIDFGHLAEVTAVATQGHPKEYKWVLTYVLKYALGKHWHTYQESGIDKVHFLYFRKTWLCISSW